MASWVWEGDGMKKLTIILIMMLLLVTSSCYFIDNAMQNSTLIFDTDYIEKYERTLNVMFDYEWTVISAEERFMEACREFCSSDAGRARQFIEWVIEYQDGNGDIRHFRFNNSFELSRQIAFYVERYITEYYSEHFFAVHMSDVPLAPSARVFGFIVNASVNRHHEENQELVRVVDGYRNLLATPEGAIRLSRLTPANVFEMVPIRLAIHVSLSGDYNLGQPFEEEVKRKIENMIDDMNRFTNNQLTASVLMGYSQVINLYTGNRGHTWYYIRGESVCDITNLWYFERYVFESFRGVFW